jgi:hypothetical protein
MKLTLEFILNNIEEESLKFYIFTSNELYYHIDTIANIQDMLKREFNVNRIKTCLYKKKSQFSELGRIIIYNM